MEFTVGKTFEALAMGEVRKIHIVATVEDNRVVYKYYIKKFQRWIYEVKLDSDLEFIINLTAQEE